MREIEAKILEINKEKIDDTLARMGAKKVFDGEMETFFYDFKNGSIVAAKNVLRLRKENEKVVLTYKQVSENQKVKIAEEYSADVSDLGVMQKILEALGLVVIGSMRKHRISYELEGAHFDVDRYLGDYSHIPEFLEIEADSKESIHKYAKALGFKAEACLPWSTVQLIDYYSERKKQKATEDSPPSGQL
jgi:adenylate cyclase class 2